MRWLLVVSLIAAVAYWQLGPHTEKRPATLVADGAGAVQIYTTANCGNCQWAKRYMREQQIVFVEYDLAADRSHLRRFQELGGRAVPLILIHEEKLVGFTPESFENARAKAAGVSFFR